MFFFFGCVVILDLHLSEDLIFINSFQFLSSSLDTLVKNEHKKYLSQAFNNKVLDLVKQKRYYSFKYMSCFEKFKEKLLSKKKVL